MLHMARVTCEVEIAAPVEQVWTLMQDPMRRGEWDFRVTGGRFTKEGCPTKGATFTVAGRLLVPFRFDMEYLAVTPFRQTVVRLVKAHGMPMVHTGAGSWTYVREGADRTIVRTVFRVELRRGWRMLGPDWIVTPVLHLVTKRSLIRLKRLLERS